VIKTNLVGTKRVFNIFTLKLVLKPMYILLVPIKNIHIYF